MTGKHYQRICALRSLMAEKGWDAVVLRGSDPHCSEYFPQRYQSVQYLCGFTGEAADMVVTADHAGLWTDSRYFIQATRQLEGTGVQLHKTRLPESVYIPQFLCEAGLRTVACDSLCESSSSLREIRDACASTPGFTLVEVPDLPDLFWEDRPAVPCTSICTLDEESIGMTRAQKLSWLRGQIEDKDCDAAVLSALDEIAWMLNVRGEDIDYNPLVYSYLIVGQDFAQWFVRKDNFDEADLESLDSFAQVESDGVSVEAYSDVFREISLLGAQGGTLCYDPATANGCLEGAIKASFEDRAVALASPIPLKKAVKTPQEQELMREAFLEDGLAVEKFLYWLETEVRRRGDGPDSVSEWEAAQKLHSLREEIPGFMGESFETISAWGSGAALPHYCTPKDGGTKILPRGLYLCDSGGQYLMGTTDITRTVPVGECTQQEMEDYTLVLKGMIDLSMAVFPYGTAGCQVDALAREPLWRSGRDFGHGTGHGIGFWLCVHEGPQSIRQNFLSQPLLPGMVTSNEPGLYREGSHGIRHENVVLCRDAFTTEFGRFLCFETLTCCHIDTGAVMVELLGEEELHWLNSYNARVYKNFAPAIEDEAFLDWLRRKTAAI